MNTKNHSVKELHDEVQDDAIVAKALVWSGMGIAVVVVLVLGFLYFMKAPEVFSEGNQTTHDDLQVRQTANPAPYVPFADVTVASRIAFVHTNGATGRKLLPETMGGGGAIFDFDGDGDLDLLFINSTYWDYDRQRKGSGPTSGPTMALYRNDGDWKFVDVTRQVELDVSFYGMGVAVGDYDNDGDDDIYVTALGENHLFRNESGASFTDVTPSAGVAGNASDWSTSTTFLDYDNDGNLDLFVCNYVSWTQQIDESQEFTLDGTGRAYGPPKDFGGSYPVLYHNEGNGTFRDVSKEMGVQLNNKVTGVPIAKSMGVVPFDFDRDGWIDIVVANDTVQNFLFHNQQGRGFKEIAPTAGVAFDSEGKARGAMGIDVAYFRNDHCVGITIGNFANEMSALYLADRQPLLFSDAAISTGVGPPTRTALTFGMFFFDFDLDGRLDILAANGHLEDDINRVFSTQKYEQPPQLFWNSGPGHGSEFTLVDGAKCGADFVAPIVGRGAAYGDLDGDGDLDVVIFACGMAPRLLRNDQTLGHHWIRFDLSGTTSNRSAIGAVVDVMIGEQTIRRQVNSTRSYLSQCDRSITIGLGNATQIDKVLVHWPGGKKIELDGAQFEVDRRHEIKQE